MYPARNNCKYWETITCHRVPESFVSWNKRYEQKNVNSDDGCVDFTVM